VKWITRDETEERLCQDGRNLVLGLVDRAHDFANFPALTRKRAESQRGEDSTSGDDVVVAKYSDRRKVVADVKRERLYRFAEKPRIVVEITLGEIDALDGVS